MDTEEVDYTEGITPDLNTEIQELQQMWYPEPLQDPSTYHSPSYVGSDWPTRMGEVDQMVMMEPPVHSGNPGASGDGGSTPPAPDTFPLTTVEDGVLATRNVHYTP